jgi:hypothetical protein
MASVIYEFDPSTTLAAGTRNHWANESRASGGDYPQSRKSDAGRGGGQPRRIIGGWRAFVKRSVLLFLSDNSASRKPSPGDPQQGCSIARVRHARSDDKALRRNPRSTVPVHDHDYASNAAVIGHDSAPAWKRPLDYPSGLVRRLAILRGVR